MTKSSRSTRGVGGGLANFVMVLPSWAWYLGLFLIPASIIFVFSLGTSSGRATVDLSSLNFDSYSTATGGTFWQVFRATMQISILGTIICLLIGLPFAYTLATRVRGVWRGIVLAVVIVPFWTNFLMRTYAWAILLAPKGFLSEFLMDINLIDGPLRFLNTRGAVQLGIVYNYLPLMILPLYVALERLAPELREASKDLGASRFRTFFKVTLPLAMPGIVSGCLLVFIPLSGDFVTARVLGGAQGFMVGNDVYTSFIDAGDFAVGSATAVVLIFGIMSVIAVVGITYAILRTLLRIKNERSLSLGTIDHTLAQGPVPDVGGLIAPLRRTTRHVFIRIWRLPKPLGNAARFVRDHFVGAGLGLWFVAVIVFLYIPIVTFVVFSFNSNRVIVLWDEFSLVWWKEAFNNTALKNSLQNSFQVAVVSTILATIVGTLGGVALAKRPSIWSKVLLGIILLIMVTPEIVDAIGLLIWFVQIDLTDGLTRMMLGHSVFSSAVVALIVRSRLSGLDENLDEASADLGAGPYRTMWKVTIPLALPAIIAGALLAFTLSLDNVIVSSFVSDADSQSFPAFVLGTLRTGGVRGDVAATSTMLLGLTLGALALVAVVLKKSGGSSREITETLTAG